MALHVADLPYAMSKILKGAAVIGQSGGPTAVINQSLVGFIETATQQEVITRVYGARHGVQGIMCGDLVDLAKESAANLEAVAQTPAAALGSVRLKASADDVKAATGFTIGGCSPVAHKMELPMVIDVSLKRFETLYASAGHSHCVFPTTVGELKRLTGGIVSYNIAEPVSES